MADHGCLGDHPAERDAHHVRRPDAEPVEQTYCVIGHIVEEVRHRDFPTADHRDHVGQPGVVEPGRQPDIPVVEHNDAKPPLTEEVAELPRPCGELRAETVDEQERPPGGIAALFVLDGNPVDVGGRHAGMLARPSPVVKPAPRGRPLRPSSRAPA